MRSAAAFARATRLLAGAAGGEDRAGAVGAAAERREDVARARGRSGPGGPRRGRRAPRRARAPPAVRRGSASPRRRPAACAGPSTSSVAERRVDREPVQVDAGHRLDELGVVAAAEPRGDLDHLRPVGPDPQLGVRRAVLDPERGQRPAPRCQTPSRCLTPADGQTCASATPKAGGSATIRSVTASAVKAPSTEKPTTVTSGPSTSSSTSASAVARGARAPSRSPSGRLGRVLDERQPLLPLPVGRLHDDGAVDLGRLVAAADDPPPRLRHARLGEPLALAELVRREHRRLPARSGAAARPARRSRAATPTGQSVPGEMIPSIPSAADQPLDRRLVLGREDAAAVGEPEAGRGRIAVDDGDPEAARARRLEQPELCGPGA